jgi:hypothetical protein
MPRVSAGIVSFDGPWIRTRLSSAAGVIADRARAISGTWSTRVPESVRLYLARGQVVTIAAGGIRAPQAYTFENPRGGPGVWHPVFGHGPRNTWHWARQTPRPFLAPAGDEAAGQAADVFAKVVDDWAAASGFK